MAQKGWGILFGVVLGGIFVFTAVSPFVGWWLPHGISSYSPNIDFLFKLILWVTAFFFVLTEAILVYNMIKFAHVPGRKSEFTHGSVKLEALWTVIPAVILVALGFWQIGVWADIKYPTRIVEQVEKGDYLQVEMAARQWEYRMRYPSPERIARWDADHAVAVTDFRGRLTPQADDIFVVNDLHVVKGQKVLVFLKTRDVGHSLFLPNVRVKQDALPGRTIPVWFECTESNTKRDGTEWKDGYLGDKADRAGVYDLVCTQYCGSRHSMMRGKLFVHPDKADFLAWLKQAQAESYQRTTAAAN